ncbi:helix-turn-helix transcriptional regulator [Demequina capsici]|uniref:Helix-turn-helix transcriptional regulator n=1 Tax=Demequina capsici TaxID=3075620 RepID=A0AA96F7D8_9MICO|nr:helix-turn-helix transcriptional regulator [Demequina sp. OYTSA14]WNM24518.1 helix-turn-helix transcriptional regulator [Demequina sp. OYTSA14]
MDPDELAPLVGDRLRAVRADRGLSLNALAAAAGIGKGSLSEIERGSRNPNLSTLYALANALDLPLAWLLAERPGAEVGAPGIETVLLGTTGSVDDAVEVYTLRLTPGTVHRSSAHGPHVVEHLVVTRGVARVGRSGGEVMVKTGEHYDWVSDTEHTYEAVGEPAEAVLVMRRVPAS